MVRRALAALLLLAPLLWGCIPELDRTMYCDDGGSRDRVLHEFRLPDFPAGGETVGPGCTTSCPLGCNEILGRCNRLKPSNLDASKLYDASSAALAPAADVTVDTDTGEIKEGATVVRAAGNQGSAEGGVFFDVVTQSGGPEIAVFGLASLDLPQGQTITVSGTRALALYATDKVSLAGTVVVAATQGKGGPGGFDGGAKDSQDGAACSAGEGKGGEQGPGGSDGDGGGGGGGFGGKGGAGADSNYPNPSPPSAGGAGGATNGDASLSPLRGGCGGGAGGGPENGPGGYGGGGGGAIQISVDGALTVSGTITAPGAGGDGGHDGAGGGGGGSGGAILLEAVTLEVTGVLAANGGGGGSGSGGPGDQNAPDGQDGQPGSQAAAGGPQNQTYGGPGGAGGAGTAPDGIAPAAQSVPHAANAGGGGGGVGRIRLNGSKVTSKAATLSPAATQGTSGTW